MCTAEVEMFVESSGMQDYYLCCGCVLLVIKYVKSRLDLCILIIKNFILF
jgi:hypothetical protein